MYSFCLERKRAQRERLETAETKDYETLLSTYWNEYHQDQHALLIAYCMITSLFLKLSAELLHRFRL